MTATPAIAKLDQVQTSISVVLLSWMFAFMYRNSSGEMVKDMIGKQLLPAPYHFRRMGRKIQDMKMQVPRP